MSKEIRLLLLADTHIPKRARDLPDEVWRAVADADVVIHAGDWVDVRLLERLESRAGTLLGCYGNNDGADLRARLPRVARAQLGRLEIAVVHETGAAAGRELRSERDFPDVDVLVFGHSHIPWDTTSPRGLRLLNPGSCTDRRRQPFCTYMTATITRGYLEVMLHRLPPRDGNRLDVRSRFSDRLRRMTMESWVAELARELDVPADVNVKSVLDLARIAAHTVDRPAAPVTTFLAGLAAGRRGGTADDIQAAVDAAGRLARSWGKRTDAEPPP